MVTDTLIGRTTDTSDYSANQISLAENCALSFWEWEKEHKIEEVYWVEKPLVSEVYLFGGTADIYCKIAGKRELLDLKTGSGIYDEHKWQVATLSMLSGECGHIVDNCRVLNIPRTEDEKFREEVLTTQEIETGWLIFQHLLKIYYLKKAA